jgi:acrylyl-CoA reductase (NADPH)
MYAAAREINKTRENMDKNGEVYSSMIRKGRGNMKSFQALVVNETEEHFTLDIKHLIFDDLMRGEVTIQVAYSSVNYKDGLACIPNGRIVKSYPFVPGIDLAGTVVSSTDSRFHEGDEVIVTGSSRC